MSQPAFRILETRHICCELDNKQWFSGITFREDSGTRLSHRADESRFPEFLRARLMWNLFKHRYLRQLNVDLVALFLLSKTQFMLSPPE